MHSVKDKLKYASYALSIYEKMGRGRGWTLIDIKIIGDRSYFESVL